MKLRIDKIQLLLHKVLARVDDHWTKHILNTLNELNIGWSFEINKKLKEYQLEANWSKIVEKTSGEWKELVTKTIEEENQKQLLNMCYNDRRGEKTKTKYRRTSLVRTQLDRKPRSIVFF